MTRKEVLDILYKRIKELRDRDEDGDRIVIAELEVIIDKINNG